MKVKGFTLIELFIVITIIMIIAAMFLPLLGGGASSVKPAVFELNQAVSDYTDHYYMEVN